MPQRYPQPHLLLLGRDHRGEFRYNGLGEDRSSAMPGSTAKKYDALFKVVVTIVVMLIGALGATLGMFAGYLIAVSIFASPDVSIDGQAIGGTVGLTLSAWYVAVAAKRL
jgi:hypothetical protein